MRIVTVAAVMLALIAVPAEAQVSGKRPQSDIPKRPDEPMPVDEKAYKAAVDRIPDAKTKYDPWAVTRPAEPAKPAETAKKPKP